MFLELTCFVSFFRFQCVIAGTNVDCKEAGRAWRQRLHPK